MPIHYMITKHYVSHPKHHIKKRMDKMNDLELKKGGEVEMMQKLGEGIKNIKLDDNKSFIRQNGGSIKKTIKLKI